jgi:hypothetical protein
MDLLYHDTQASIEESPDSLITGCPPWPHFLYFWVTLWPLALCLSP